MRSRLILTTRSLTPYHAYVGISAAVATVIVVAAAPSAGLYGRADTFVLLAAFTLVGELLPIKVPRRGSFEYVTTSIAYAFALLLLFGLAPAALAYAGACVLADLPRRKAVSRVVFNAAQCVLVVSAGAAALALTGVELPVDSVGANLAAILAAAACFFIADNVLTGIAVALLARGSFISTLVADPGFYSWTTGSLLALGPVVAQVALTSNWLAVLPSVPILAIYIGGHYAVRNNERALHDELTGLPNQRLLLEELHDELAARGTRETVTLTVFDVTDFKAVNEALGREPADELLVALGRRLQASFGDNHIVARLSGDEFAVVRRGDGAPDDLCSDVIHILESPFTIGGLALEMHAACGAAVAPADADEGDELLKRANVALRHAKQDVSLWTRYTPGLDASDVDRLLLAGQLRRAIDAGELCVHYQPKLALREGELHGVEALVRWNHPELGTIGPAGFIPLAERTGLITPLTRHVLEVATRQCADWRRIGLDVRMAVNLSPRSLLDARLPIDVAEALQRCGLPSSFLQVEVIETRLVHDMQRARGVLGELRSLGVGVAIDDFGTGYSSLAQLQALDFDELKIDKSFVMRMDSEEGPAAIVRSTIDLARHLGLSVTAEGVESTAVMSQLAALGCDYAQGFCIAPPLPADACREKLVSFGPPAARSQRIFGRAQSKPEQLAT